MDRAARQCVGIFFLTIAFAAALWCAYQIAPNRWTGLFFPQNRSVWELSKIALWPCMAAVLLCHAKNPERGSLCAYLMVPAALPVALLFVYWFFHMVCGICSSLLDAVIWLILLAVGDLTALSLRKTPFMRRGIAAVCALLGIWIVLYCLFSLCPAEFPLFSETVPRTAAAAIGW